MKEKIFGSNMENKETRVELRVRIDRGGQVADLIEELKMGGTVQFILTKNFDLWLSNMGHERIRSKNGIQHEDIETTGAAWVSDNILEIEYRDSATNNEREAIRKELESLV
jgi:hypothetical protein